MNLLENKCRQKIKDRDVETFLGRNFVESSCSETAHDVH